MKNNKRRNQKWQHKYNKLVKVVKNQENHYKEGYNDGYYKGYKLACEKLLKSFNIGFCYQQLEAADAGLEVNVEKNIKYKTSELLNILRDNKNHSDFVKERDTKELFLVCVKRVIHSTDESPCDSFSFETIKEAEDFREKLINEDYIDPERIWIAERKTK